jgi:hypothetical protein
MEAECTSETSLCLTTVHGGISQKAVVFDDDDDEAKASTLTPTPWSNIAIVVV